MNYPDDFINKIVCGDILKIMKNISDNSIGLVVTSPPYNLKNSTGNGMKDGRGGKWANAALQKGYSHHNDCMPHKEYVKWQRSLLRGNSFRYYSSLLLLSMSAISLRKCPVVNHMVSSGAGMQRHHLWGT